MARPKKEQDVNASKLGSPQTTNKEDQTGEETTTLKSPSLNRTYEEWPVKPRYEDVTDQMGKVLGKKLIDFEKQAQKPLRTTVVTEDKAEILNSQSENTGLRLYEID